MGRQQASRQHQLAPPTGRSRPLGQGTAAAQPVPHQLLLWAGWCFTATRTSMVISIIMVNSDFLCNTPTTMNTPDSNHSAVCKLCLNLQRVRFTVWLWPGWAPSPSLLPGLLCRTHNKLSRCRHRGDTLGSTSQSESSLLYQASPSLASFRGPALELALQAVLRPARWPPVRRAPNPAKLQNTPLQTTTHLPVKFQGRKRPCQQAALGPKFMPKTSAFEFIWDLIITVFGWLL